MQRQFTSVQALDPGSGGEGEWHKAQLLNSLLTDCDTRFYNCPDSRIDKPRPNIVAIKKGKSPKKLWLFSHLDVVSPGDPNLWSSNPWQATIRDDLIYGRGVEDNQQALISMLVLLKSLNELEITPDLSLGLVFMADEETGSNYGLKWLLDNHYNIFSKRDYYIVPDGGSPDASLIEIAEKAQLWLKFSVFGKQCHASNPGEGINSLVAASALVLELGKLNVLYRKQNPLFIPPYSSFEPTRHDCNVDAVNILPGRDSFYMDCRLLPELKAEEVLRKCREIIQAIEKLYRVKIDLEVVHRQPATSVNPEIRALKLLQQAVKQIYGVKTVLAGIGGATVASFLRQKGLPALVWSCLQNTCHQPDEHSSIAATLKDAAVFGLMLEAGTS